MGLNVTHNVVYFEPLKFLASSLTVLKDSTADGYLEKAEGTLF